MKGNFILSWIFNMEKITILYPNNLGKIPFFQFQLVQNQYWVILSVKENGIIKLFHLNSDPMYLHKMERFISDRNSWGFKDITFHQSFSSSQNGFKISQFTVKITKKLHHGSAKFNYETLSVSERSTLLFSFLEKGWYIFLFKFIYKNI